MVVAVVGHDYTVVAYVETAGFCVGADVAVVVVVDKVVIDDAIPLFEVPLLWGHF